MKVVVIAELDAEAANLRAAIGIVAVAFLFDDSSYDEPSRLVAVYERGRVVRQRPPSPGWTKGLSRLARA